MGHHNVAVSKASKRNLTSAAVRLRGCSLASAIVYLFVCLFVCYRSSGTLVSFYDGDSGVFYRCGTTDLNNPVETNDFTTLLQIFPNCTPHDSWKHMETSSALWKSNPWLQLFESRLSSLLDRFPVSWIQQISWILGNKNRGDRSDLPFIYCSG